MGNVTSITDSNGNITKYWYSPVGELIKTEDAMGNQFTYEYDELGNLTTLKKEEVFEQERKEIEKMNTEQKEKNITFYQRNKMGQVTKIKDVLGNTEEFSYYESGQIKEKIDKEGNKTSYTYTKTGDIERVIYEDGEYVKFHYNCLKQLVMIEDWLGLTKIEPDLLGRPKKITDYKERETLYEWNTEGKLKQITYPDKTTVNYNYDFCGRLSCLEEGNNKIHYEYDKDGFLKLVEFPNGIITTYEYNNKGYLLKLNHNYQNQCLDSYQYQYDKAGNKIQISKNRKGLREESGNYLYKYDALNRLTKVIKDTKEIAAYQYDAFGNRNFLKYLEKEIFYSYNANNQLIQKKENEITTEYKYDKRGNLIKTLENGELTFAYEYNAKNRLNKVYNTKGLSAMYTYNGLGYRVKKELGSIEKQNKMITIYKDPSYQPYIGKIDGKFQTQKQIDYIIDLTKQYNNLLMIEEEGINQSFLWDKELVKIKTEEGFGYYCQDELGSPIRLLWNNGEKEIYGYHEFGEDFYQNLNNKQPFGYTGYQREEGIPLYFAQGRYYDPLNGRFLQEDIDKGELKNLQTLNYYIYCMQNPLIYVDLLGNWPTWKEIKDGIADFGDKAWKTISTIGGGIVGAAPVIGGGAVVVGSVTAAPTTLAGVGVGVGGMTHGANSVYNSVRDMGHIINGEWDKVGTENFLKDEVYAPGGAWIGGLIGGEEGKKVGENIGKVGYSIMDIALCTKSIKDGFELLYGHEWVYIRAPLYEDQGIKDTILKFDVKDPISKFTNIFTKFNIAVNTKTLILDDLIPAFKDDIFAVYQSIMDTMIGIGSPVNAHIILK